MQRSNDAQRYPITEYFRADPSQPPPGLAGLNIPSSPVSVSIEYQGSEIEVVNVYGATFVDTPENWLSSAPVYVPRYTLGEADEAYDSRPYYAVILRARDGESACCLVRASGFTEEPTGHCVAAAGNQLALAIGDTICGLSIPTLALRWSIEWNEAGIYGVLGSPDDTGFITHAMGGIAKTDFTGNVIWRVNTQGQGDFIEDLTVFPDHIDAACHNGSIYRIDVYSGESTFLAGSLVSTPGGTRYPAIHRGIDKVSIEDIARVPARSQVRARPAPRMDPFLKFLLVYAIVFVAVVLLAYVSYFHPRLWVLYAGLLSAWIIKASIEDAKRHIVDSNSMALGIIMAVVTVVLAWLLFR